MLQLVAGGLQPITNEVTVTMRFRLVENNEKEIVDFQVNSNYNIVEDLEEPSKIIDNDTSDHGMLGLINSLIISEYDAIDQYNSAIATAEAAGELDAVPIFKDIIAEEHVHVGQLQAAAKLFDQSAKEVATGIEEAQDQLEQGEIDQAKLDNEIIESL